MRQRIRKRAIETHFHTRFCHAHVSYNQWLHDSVATARLGLADGTNKLIEPEEWERIREGKLARRKSLVDCLPVPDLVSRLSSSTEV